MKKQITVENELAHAIYQTEYGSMYDKAAKTIQVSLNFWRFCFHQQEQVKTKAGYWKKNLILK